MPPKNINLLNIKTAALNIDINKELKENLRNKYVKYCIEVSKSKVAKNTTIEWVDEVWYSDSIITNQIILNSFIYSGISSELNGSENHQFRDYED